jgi:hypothetical protein
MRYAIVTNARSRREVEAYLPDNFEVLAERGEETREGRFVTHAQYLIGGHDVAGWTLDGYVIPRLGSGLIQAIEVEAFDAAVFATTPLDGLREATK